MSTNYKAFYRTYRPSNFDEVVGQDHIVKTLVNLIRMGKISHGYLFSGPRGTGKTSIAKIFANAINCIHSEKPEQICQQCLKNSNSSLDIIEIDAASNNSVNDVRTIREQVEFSPTSSPYKIYIIDEVHMLSKGAFNALLMTLEEPPKHAIFILATTNPDKIPDTILSRVQRYNFKRISKSTLIKQLKFIFNNEKINYNDQAVEMIANLANGSLRDALSIADQINAFSNSNINVESIIEIFGLSTIENQVMFLNLLAKKYVSESLEYFDNLINNGVDISRFINSLIELLKDYLIYQKTKNENLIDVNNVQFINQILFRTEIVYKILDILILLLNEIKYSDIPQQLTQLAIIKICSFDESLIDLDKKNHTIESLKTTQINKTIPIEDSEKLKLNNTENISQSRDITDEYFSKNNFDNSKLNSNETIYNKNQFTKTILSDFSSEKIEEKFEKLIDTFSFDTEIEKLKNEKISKENISDKEEIIDNTTELLNLSREIDGNEKEIDESLLNQYETNKQIFDTNEIEVNALAESLKTDTFDTASEEAPFSFESEKINDKNNVEKKETKEFSVENNLIQEEEKDLFVTPKKLNQPKIINLFLLSKKDTFEIFKEKLNNAMCTLEEDYDTYAVLFKEVKFICSANDFILVSSEEDWVVDDLNEKTKEEKFRKFISNYFGNNVHFYAITKKEYIVSKDLYKELEKSKNIPEPKPLEKITNSDEGESRKKDETLNEIENKSKMIFGNVFNRKKE